MVEKGGKKPKKTEKFRKVILSAKDGITQNTVSLIKIRNSMLDMILFSLNDVDSTGSADALLERLVKPEDGPLKWFTYFVEEDINPYTVVLMVRLLCKLLISRPILLQRFRASQGFVLLKNSLIYHWRLFQLYHALFALFFGIDPKFIHLDSPIDAPSFCKILDEARDSSPAAVYCPEALEIILAMTKKGIDSTLEAHNELLREDDADTVDSRRDNAAGAGAADEFARDNEWCKSVSGTLEGIINLQRFVLDLIAERFGRVSEFREHCFKADFFDAYTALIFPALFSEDLGTDFMDPRDLLGYPIDDAKITPKRTLSQFDQLFVQNIREHALGFVFVVAKDVVLGSSKTPVPALDMLLDSCASVPESLQNIFVSRILFKLIDDFKRLIGARPPNGDVPAVLREQRFFSNLLKFCNLVIDRIRQDWFINGSEIMFHFLSEIMEMLDLEELGPGALGGNSAAATLRRLARVSSKDELLLSLFKVFNRIVLHQFDAGFTDQARLELGTRILYFQKVILNPVNSDADFLKTICFNLYSYLLSEDPLVSGIAVNLWKMVLIYKGSEVEPLLKTKIKTIEPNSVLDGFKRLLDPERGTFVDYLANKKEDVRQVMDENFSKSYQTLKAQEGKITTEGKAASQQRKQARVKKEQKDERTSREVVVTDSVASTARFNRLVEDEGLTYLRLDKEANLHSLLSTDQWEKMSRQLHQERAVWGNMANPHLRRWKLDLTEGPMRMRKKMEPNERFYLNYPQNPKDIPADTDYRPAASYHLEEYLASRPSQKLQKEPGTPTLASQQNALYTTLSTSESPSKVALEALVMRKDNAGTLEEEDPAGSVAASGTADAAEGDDASSTRRHEKSASVAGSLMDTTAAAAGGDQGDKEDGSDEEYEDKAPEGEEATQADGDRAQPRNNIFLNQLLGSQKIIDKFNCARISALDICEGIFVIAEHAVAIVDGFFKKPNGEIIPISEAPVEGREYALLAAKNTPQQLSSSSLLQHARDGVHIYHYKEIKEVHRRRYLLRNVAMEIFEVNGRNSLVAFDNLKVRDQIYNRAVSKVKASIVTTIEARAADAAAMSSRLQSFLLGVSSLTEFTAKWERREITNFEYLMQLNTLAGRSYNDLTQYPVFPWILKDYASEYLDLTNPGIYRDLSKPMGAQTPDRLRDFASRYEEMEGDTDTPRFHYGTHYSSAMTVCLYLIRMEPFTQEFLKLQDNHFDRPDRLFHSIKDAWESASQINAIDVRELVPEFFYLPEVLMNENRFDFGVKENQVRLDNVVLPPWSKGDPSLFVRIHRQALESEYVSTNIHNWIDLIFGYKQRGKPAEDACNIFHYLSYEGNVDIDKITDPVEKMATIGIINNFGQTPAQLFKVKHPARVPLPSQMIVTVPLSVMPLAKPKGDVQAADGAAGLDGEDAMPLSSFSQVSLTGEKPAMLVPSFHYSPQKLLQSAAPFREIDKPVMHLDFKNEKHVVCGPRQLPIPTNPNKYVEWGYLDNSIRLLSTENFRSLATYESAHLGQVTAAVFADDDRLITGGEDSVVSVWRILKRQRQELRPQKDLTGHVGPITSLAVSSTYSFIVSGSTDGTCIIWDLNQLRYIRTLRNLGGVVTVISINEVTGEIATCAGTQLMVWSINGDLLAKVNTSTAQDATILACCFLESRNSQGDIVFTAHANSKIRMWAFVYNAAVNHYESHLHTEHWRKGDGDGNAEPNWTLERIRNIDVVANRDIPGKTNRSKVARITAITAVSEQKRIYAGTSTGYVYAWSFPDSDDKHWVKDSAVETCMGCGQVKFTIKERKHHCRSCGGIFCSNCCTYEAKIPECVNIPRPVKQCEACFKATNDS